MARSACKNISIKDVVAGFCACMNFAVSMTLLFSLNALFTDWLNSFAGSRGSTTAVQATSTGVTFGGEVMPGSACKNISIQDVFAVFCACMNFATPLTLLYAMNALFTDWLSSFDGSRGSITAVQATCIGVTLGGGLIAGLIERKLGERMSLMTGSVLAALGLFSGGFARNLPMLIVCLGVITGSGFCLIHLSTLSMAMRRFRHNAGFVSSAMATVGGVMHLGTPLLYRYLSEVYSWRGCLILASGLSLHTAIFGLLLTSPLLNTPQPSGIQSASRDLVANVAEYFITYEAVPLDIHNGGDPTRGKWDSVRKMEGLVEKAPESRGDVVAMVTEECDLKHRDRRVSEEDEVKLMSAGDDRQYSTRDAQNTREAQNPKDSHNLAQRTQKENIFLQNSDCKDSLKSDQRLQSQLERVNDNDGIVEQSNEDDQEREQFLHSDHTHNDTHQQKKHFKNNKDVKTDDGSIESHEKKQLKSKYSNDGSIEFQDNQEPKNTRAISGWKSQAAFLRNPLYLSVLVLTVTALSLIVCFAFLVLDFALLQGWTVEDGVMLNFAYQLFNLVSRVAMGVASLHRRVHSVMLLVVCGLIGSLGLCLIGQASSFPVACVFYSCMGAGYGGVVGMFPPAVLAATGPAAYPLALGLLCTVEGVFDVVAGISTGFLVDLGQSYSIISLVYGTITFAATCLLLVVFRCCQPIKTLEGI